ncbi:MAG: hypothetical protein AB7Q37_15580 [Pyrinomonadaceae bacterium]
MKLFKSLELLLVAAAAAQAVAADSIQSKSVCSKVDSSSVLYNFDRDEKATSHSNDETDVDQMVLANVRDQLRKKIGSDFMSSVHFSHVRGVDFDSKGRLSLDNLRRIDVYDFTFEVRIGVGGAYKYAFAIGTEKTGKFLRDVEIPNIASSPDKAIIQPCSDAVTVARNAKVLTENKQIFVKLRFDRVADIFVWDVYAYRSGPALHSDHVWVNANTLAVQKIYDQSEAL